MPTTFWNGNGQAIAQTTTLTVTAVSVGGTLTATINTKNITYTCVTGDTTSSAASAWLALLQNSSVAPPEFNELTYTVSSNVITVTASVPGTPYTLTSSSGGGATVSQSTTVANSSPSDVNNANNWLRAGSPSIPQNGDDVVLQDSSIPLLWNLNALAAVTFLSFTRWQSFTGTVGLPENNPLGYFEYRPTYFKFIGSGAGFTMQLGVGNVGSGPGRERYDTVAQQTLLVIQATGAPIDDYAIRWKGTNANNVVRILNGTLGVAMLPGETAAVLTATADGGGTAAFGPGVTLGTITANAAQVELHCVPGTIDVQNGSQLTVWQSGGTFTNVTARSGSRVSWLSGDSITNLVLQTSSVFDKSGDFRAITINNSTQDGDTTQILDPLSTITYTNATSVLNAVSTGPFVYGPGKTVKVT